MVIVLEPGGVTGLTVKPGSANKPITIVSWFDAARFCNWLHNGQGSGSTETGAYTLNGAMSGIYMKNQMHICEQLQFNDFK